MNDKKIYEARIDAREKILVMVGFTTLDLVAVVMIIVGSAVQTTTDGVESIVILLTRIVTAVIATAFIALAIRTVQLALDYLRPLPTVDTTSPKKGDAGETQD